MEGGSGSVRWRVGVRWRGSVRWRVWCEVECEVEGGVEGETIIRC